MIAIYARVSTEDQVKGYSIGNQIDECIKKAGTNEVLQYVDEGISGEILERASLTRLRDDVQKGIIDEIICYDPDRLSRKLMHQLLLDDEFRKNGVYIKFVNGEYAQTAEGQLFFSMRGAIAEFEKEKIKQRTLGGKLKKAKSGKVSGDYGLYGYDYEKTKETYVINEEQAKIVRMIFDYFTDPLSPFKGMNGIANHLTSMNIPTARNKGIWHRNVVRQILTNESYTGRHAQNKTNDMGNYVRIQSGQKRIQTLKDKEDWIYVKIPRIISDEQFEVAQELIEVSRRRFSKSSKHEYLLSGLLRCEECNNTMVGHRAKWWGETVFIYNDRKNSAGAKNPGCGNQLRVSKLDNVVWEYVLELLNEPEKVLEHKKNEKVNNFLIQEIKQLEIEIEKIKKGRKQLVRLAALSEDDLDLTDIKLEMQEMQQKEKSLQEQYTKLNNEIEDSKQKETNENMFKMAYDLYITYKDKEMPFEIKKQIIRTMVKQIYVSKDHEEVSIHLF